MQSYIYLINGSYRKIDHITPHYELVATTKLKPKTKRKSLESRLKCELYESSDCSLWCVFVDGSAKVVNFSIDFGFGSFLFASNQVNLTMQEISETFQRNFSSLDIAKTELNKAIDSKKPHLAFSRLMQAAGFDSLECVGAGAMSNGNCLIENFFD